ncbi:TRAP transporter small permease [Puniceibacterium sp. IMCC21224]|uniref:TRAP transporter small permease n=1 Tax=Puniceibacterium sp. IMCC21224 TaxID=1618204 RepID=UPI00064E13CF|nr:TRAP transporter small permease [Puniceibacterium sp. IMCC21224]KMK67035.1 TRAP-type C4-dicarboxylate transport system, small permease component [Puniceibacterium sp. IMCC21224]
MALAETTRLRVGDGIECAAQALAILGGLILCAMAVMTMVSIAGRILGPFGLGPVRGDYELVANGCALAVFAFLPYCQLKRGHVTVDILTGQFSPRLQAVFGLIGDALIAVAAVLITRQLWFGFGEKFPYGSDVLRAALGMGSRPFFPETTYELAIPVWIPYGLAVMGAGVFALVSLFCVWRAAAWVLDGQESAT